MSHHPHSSRDLFRAPPARPDRRHWRMRIAFALGVCASVVLCLLLVVQMQPLMEHPTEPAGPSLVVLLLISIHLTFLHLLHGEVVRVHGRLLRASSYYRSLAPLQTNKQFAAAVNGALLLLLVFALFIIPGVYPLSWVVPSVIVFNVANYCLALRGYVRTENELCRYWS